MNFLQTSLVVLGAIAMPAIAIAAPASPANPAYPDSPANPAHPDYLAAPAAPANPATPANPAEPGIPFSLSCPEAKNMTCESQTFAREQYPYWTCGYKDPATGNMISFSLYSKKRPLHIVLKNPTPTLTGNNDSAIGVCEYEGRTHDGQPFSKVAVVLHK